MVGDLQYRPSRWSGLPRGLFDGTCTGRSGFSFPTFRFILHPPINTERETSSRPILLATFVCLVGRGLHLVVVAPSGCDRYALDPAHRCPCRVFCVLVHLAALYKNIPNSQRRQTTRG